MQGLGAGRPTSPMPTALRAQKDSFGARPCAFSSRGSRGNASAAWERSADTVRSGVLSEAASLAIADAMLTRRTLTIDDGRTRFSTGAVEKPGLCSTIASK